MSDIEKHKVNHLLLLLGKNPLPNAVAGNLLVSPGGSITMLYTADTAPAVKYLEGFLAGVQFNEPVQIDEVDAYSIFEGVFKALNTIGNQSVGLHYTGGTKAMSAHAYRAVERWRSRKGTSCQPVFSYLDARSLEIVFDPVDPESDSGERIPVGNAVSISLEQLIKLHGWSFKKDRRGREIRPSGQAMLPNSATALAQVYSSDPGGEAWRNWKKCELGKCRTNWEWDDSKINYAVLFLSNDPSLASFNNAFKTELSLTSNQISLGAVPNSLMTGRALCEWLDGKWLEHHVLQCLTDLSQAPNSLGLHDYCNSVRTNEVDFEVDVIALRGYQLFAFSCGTGTEKNEKRELKLKLFEAFIRARQLGGDEARVALVCPANRDRVDELLYEMSRDIEPDSRIQIFGRDDLQDLKGSLENWIKEQG